ncbi:MAG: LysR family transcriptional regulator [Pseudomonadota bacterium]
MNASHETPLDWSQLQALLAVARAGSLTAAAREGALSQPTLSRRLAALETRLGATLLHRGPGGALLTDAGREAAARAEEMEAAAARLDLTAAARDGRAAPGVSGTVRLAASRVAATFLLPPILAELTEAHAALEIELAPADETADLLRREADLAVRMYRPAQDDLIARKVARLPMGLFAAPAYLARHGRPQALRDLLDHRVVGYDRTDLIRAGFARFGHPVPRRFFRLRTDDQVAYWGLVTAGAGIGVAPLPVGEADPRVERLLAGPPVAELPVWLAAHAGLRASARVSAVWEALAARLPQICAPP